MPKKQLSKDQFVDILIRHGRGESISKLADEFHVHRSTLHRRIASYRDTGKLDRLKSSRRKKLSCTDLERIKHYVTKNPFDTLVGVRVALKLDISLSTISRICRDFGLRKRICPKKFYISPFNCEKRLSVAIRRSFWTVEKWKTIAFSDESGIDNAGYYRRYVFRPAKSRYAPRYTYHPPNSSMRRRLNFFSYFSVHGTGQLVYYDAMNSEVYCQCIRIMIDDLKEKFGHEEFLVVHDNAAWSSSQYTRTFTRDHGYNRFFISIPPYSPDMNPIENLWAMLKHAVREDCFLHGRTVGAAFKELVETKWSQIPLDTINKIYTGLPDRMKAIVDSRGELTKY